VAMKVDQKVLIAHIDQLKAIGLLSKDLTQTIINMEPNIISMAFAIQMLPVATKEVYEINKNANNCDFIQSIILTDDYGNDKQMKMFSYHFTRAIYDKVNWDNFESQKMFKIAPKFAFSPEFMALVSKERASQ
jgi:hypothetical protein